MMDARPGLKAQKNAQERGFSLMELLITISIMGILMGIAGLAYNEWQRRYALESQVRTMHADLLNTRAQAMQRNTSHFVQLVPDGYTVHVDTNGTGGSAPDAGDAASPKKMLRFNSVLTEMFVFDSRGLVGPNQTIRFNTGGVSAAVDCIALHTTRIRVGKLNGADCIPK